MVKGEKEVVLVMNLRRELDLHLWTPWREEGRAGACRASAGLPNPYLVVEVGVLRVMQDCGTRCCGEDWTSRLAVNALK